MGAAKATIEATMEAAGMASKRVEAAESAVVAWVGVATMTRIQAASGPSPEGTRTVWVKASMGVARAAVGVVVGVAAGAEAKVSGMAAAVMGTMVAVTMRLATRAMVAKGFAATEGP
jgi:hypothetical protein